MRWVHSQRPHNCADGTVREAQEFSAVPHQDRNLPGSRRRRPRLCESGVPRNYGRIIDAQSVKAAATVPAGSRGYDGGKQINGRKRHIVTDCLGLRSEELPRGHRPGHQRGLTTSHVQAYRPGRAPESTWKPGHAGNYLCAVRRTGGAS
ncbi:transposase [Streptomyces sp. NPDC057199]|uniref:transposase n=1 Tax=Streptomyces sp. NPDC057199 TaxID=3346047 RepID=UPI00363424B8